MQISLILFPNASDNISALVFERHADARCWTRNYSSLQEAADELRETRIVTVEDAKELQTRLMTEQICPLFHATVEAGDLETWGFTFLGSKRAD